MFGISLWLLIPGAIVAFLVLVGIFSGGQRGDDLSAIGVHLPHSGSRTIEMDGILYTVRDGAAFDEKGRRVRDHVVLIRLTDALVADGTVTFHKPKAPARAPAARPRLPEKAAPRAGSAPKRRREEPEAPRRRKEEADAPGSFEWFEQQKRIDAMNESVGATSWVDVNDRW